MAAVSMTTSPGLSDRTLCPTQGSTHGILVETMQLVEPKQTTKVPDHLLESRTRAYDIDE